MGGHQKREGESKMTIYSDLMASRLKENREEVEKLQKAEYIVGILGQMKPELQALGLIVEGGWGMVLNARGRPGVDSIKVNMKDVKIIMDEFLFTDERLEINSSDNSQWIMTTIMDKNTGGSFRFDVAMGELECKKIEVSRNTVIREEIVYKYECE